MGWHHGVDIFFILCHTILFVVIGIVETHIMNINDITANVHIRCVISQAPSIAVMLFIDKK